jgi:4a-hydroxytetrahydrobiopterin dehydratase
MAESGTLPPGWRKDGETLAREYATSGWPATLMLVNAIGWTAEAMDHHPDLTVSWGKIGVRLSTHSAGGVTEKDYALAREIERIANEGRQRAKPLVRDA